jgi:hypothetical protein
MKKSILLYIFILVCSLLHGQKRAEGLIEDSANFKLNQIIGELYPDQSFIKKGINFPGMWMPGKLLLITGDTIDPLMLRYNSLEDQLIWLSKINGQIKLDKKSIKEFTIEKSDTCYHFVQINLAGEKKIEPGFYQLCYNGKVKFYIRHSVKPYTSYIDRNTQYYVYKPDPKYFLLINSKVIQLNRENLKSIYSAFPDFRDQIKSRVKGIRHRVRTDAEFISILMNIEDIISG